jgi:hypothetical protein
LGRIGRISNIFNILSWKTAFSRRFQPFFPYF